MSKELVVNITLVIGGIGVIVSGILYFFSYDSFFRDVERRLKNIEKKNK